MLGKLFKHEMKETGKLLLPLDLILIAATCIAAFLVKMDFFMGTTLQIIPQIYMILYVLSIVALVVLTFIYLVIRYYKTMYSSQGYLTHTLPASTASILNAKLCSTLVWMLLLIILCVISISTIGFAGAGFPSVSEFDAIQRALSEIFGMGFIPILFLIVTAIIIFSLTMILMVYACLAIGQLFGQYRIPAAIVAYIVFYILQQIVSIITLISFGATTIDAIHASSQLFITTDLTSLYRNLIFLLTGESLCFGIAYYITSLWITKRKLNLE